MAKSVNKGTTRERTTESIINFRGECVERSWDPKGKPMERTHIVFPDILYFQLVTKEATTLSETIRIKMGGRLENPGYCWIVDSSRLCVREWCTARRLSTLATSRLVHEAQRPAVLDRQVLPPCRHGKVLPPTPSCRNLVGQQRWGYSFILECFSSFCQFDN